MLNTVSTLEPANRLREAADLSGQTAPNRPNINPIVRGETPTTTQPSTKRFVVRFVLASLFVTFVAGCTAERPTLEAAPAVAPASSNVQNTRAPSDSAQAATDSGPTTTQPSAQSEPAEPSTSTSFTLSETVVDLVAPGSEPLTRLVLQPMTDATLDFVLSDERQIELTQDSVAAPRVFFASESPLIASNMPDDETIRLTIGDPVFHGSTGPTAMLELAKLASASIAGLWFEQSLSSPQLQGDGSVRAPVNDLEVAETFRGFIESFRLTQIPLPNQDLGVGAIWTTETRTLLSGLPASVKTRATIVEHDESIVVAEVVIEVLFEPGDIELPSGRATIIDGYSTLQGHLTWSQSSPLVLFDLQGTSDLRMEINDNSGTTAIHQSLVRDYALRLG